LGRKKGEVMDKDEAEKRKNEIEKLIKATLGEDDVQEIALLVRKSQKDMLSDTLRRSGLAVVVLFSKVEEHNKKILGSIGENAEDYYQSHIFLRLKDSELIFKVLQYSGMSSAPSEKAKAMVDFYTKDSFGETLQ
jgi:hypothetical protein